MKYVCSVIMALSVFVIGQQAWADDEDMGGGDSYSAQESNENYASEEAKNPEVSQADADRFDDEGNPISNGENDQTAGVSKMCLDGKNQSDICKRQRETEAT